MNDTPIAKVLFIIIQFFQIFYGPKLFIETFQINYHIDNCSLSDNTGPLIETHRDLYSSANVFSWNFWSNTFENNENGGILIHLPDTYDLLSPITHSFVVSFRIKYSPNFDPFR